jgi:hypothetical protein
LYSAFGRAEWVPDFLRGLLDPDPEARDAARGGLGRFRMGRLLALCQLYDSH